MIYIAPSLLAADFANLEQDIERVRQAGANYLHLDVMDGAFVTNISFGLPVIASLRKNSNMFFDVHLMITEPEKYVGEFCDSGADMVTVHGRTRAMLYSGVADWDMITKVKQQLSIPVIANGDIVDGEAAVKCLRRTGADGIMIGRATFGDPWVFEQARAAIDGKPIPERPLLKDRIDVAVEQFRLAEQDHGEKIACLEARKHFAWYLRGVAHSSYYKNQITSLTTMEDIYRVAKDVVRDLK